MTNIGLYIRVCVVVVLCSIIAPQVLGEEQSITERLSANPAITIIQPEVLTSRINKKDSFSNNPEAGANINSSTRQASKTAIYRVEVYADNSREAKAQATARMNNVQSYFTHYNVFLTFDSPFWRVKVGDFRSRSDAENALAEIEEAFPSYSPYLRIVRN